MEVEIVLGQKVRLIGATIYPRYGTKSSSIIRSGDYYIWDAAVVNDRVRVTNKKDSVGVPGRITGWVNLEDLNKCIDLEIGDKVMVFKDIYQYPDGSGQIIQKSPEAMYVVSIAEKSQYDIGVSSEAIGEAQGWGNRSFIKLCNI